MRARAADDLEHMLISFPVWFDLVGAELLLNSVEMIDGKLDSFVNLLSVQIHHFID